MKPIYYIEFTGRYISSDGKLSRKQISFSTKDTCTDFKIGNTLIHKGRFFKIEKVEYTKIEGAYR